MSYSSFDSGNLKPAEEIKIERRIYFNSNSADISDLTALPLEQLQTMREESAAAEQAIFENLQESTKAWEEQAGQTLSLNKAIEYVRTPLVQHTSNEWQPDPHNSDIEILFYQVAYSWRSRLPPFALNPIAITKYRIPTVHFHIVSMPSAMSCPSNPSETSHVRMKAESAQARILKI